jgi:hypothetical protein
MPRNLGKKWRNMQSTSGNKRKRAPSGMQIANGFLVGGYVHLLKGYHQLQPSRNKNESNYRIKP